MVDKKEPVFKAFIDNMDQSSYIVDPETYAILYVNKTIQNLFQDPLVGRICYEAFQDLDSPCSFCTNDKLFGENPVSPYIWEHYNEKLNMYFHCFDYAIDWGEGKKVRFEIATDITQQKKIEQELKESEEKWRALSENSPAVITMMDPDGRVQFINHPG